jgi:hypothetical protein
MALLPKAICVLPFVGQAVITTHDFITVGIAVQLNDAHMLITSLGETTFLALIGVLTYTVFTQLRRIDETWETWARLRFAVVAPTQPLTRWQRIRRWLEN